MSEEITFRIAPAIAAIKARIEGHTWFEDITVITEDKGNINNDIEVALGTITEKHSKIGACIVLLAPIAKCEHPGAPGPCIEPIIVISVVEDVAINQGATGTGKSALQIVEMLMRRIHRFSTTDTNAAFVCDDTPYKITNSDPLTYNVFFKTKLALQPEP
ncbi:MAG: hypothetical protein NT011_13485 [Kiritimatiellaeota bacterium]|nr:hypothetical protein [Kiritimatiellota bacterium]